MRAQLRTVFALLLSATFACSSDNSNTAVTSADTAKTAYIGLDASIDKAISLGFAGFNAASSANIPPQTANGNVGGTLIVSGQVDRGASANKTMNLTEAMTAYTDDGKITYGTTATAPALSMKLANIPTGTMNGTLAGTYSMTGTLTGSVSLNVSFTAGLMAGDGGNTTVARKPGTTHITGTATSGNGTYAIDITR